MRVKTTPSTILSSSSGRRESVSLTSLRWRSMTVTGCLLAYLPLSLAAAWAGTLLLRGAPAGEGPLAAFTQPGFLHVVLNLYAVVVVLSIIFFCLWLWRAARTVRRLGVTVSDVRPSTALSAFFIPVVWWWQPYATVRTLWQAAMDPNDWDNVAISQSLPLWWIMWIGQWVALVAGLAVEFVVMGPEKRFLQTVTIWVFTGCGIVSTLSLLAIILQTTTALGRQLRTRQPSASSNH